jgi:hypothetical protein
MKNYQKLNHMLLATASIPVMALFVATSAHAQDVNILGTVTANEVNAAISNNGDADLNLTFEADAVVLGGTIFLSQSA